VERVYVRIAGALYYDLTARMRGLLRDHFVQLLQKLKHDKEVGGLLGMLCRHFLLGKWRV
jgi:hypothetical protein